MPNATEQHTDSAADLQRWYCGPWCPKHGFVTASNVPSCVCDGVVPGLHTRCPETRVEGLEWSRSAARGSPGNWNWFLLDEVMEPAHAADLLIGGIIKGVVATEGFDGFERFLKLWVEEIHSRSLVPGSPEAAAIAGHRMCDDNGP